MVATVTGNLVAVTGSARAGVEVTFEPRSLPLADEGSLVVSPSTSVTTDENGDFTAALVAGDYRMVVGDDEASLALTVPSGGGSYDILELVDAVPFVGESPTATPLATSTRAGKVKTDRDEADPVVATLAALNEGLAGVDLSSRVAKSGDTMSGTLLFSADDTHDIGASGDKRPRGIYVGMGGIKVAGATKADGGIELGAGSLILTVGRGIV